MRGVQYLFFAIIILFLSCRCSLNRGDKEISCTIATLNGPSSMGMIKFIDSLSAIDKPDIFVKVFNEPMQVRKMMLEDEADLAILPMTMAALLYNKGMDYRLAAVPVWGSLYLLGRDSSIKSWGELRGKRVNVMGRGMTPDILFRYLLRINGVDPERDIVLDYSFPTHLEMANALAAGVVETGVVSEPQASLILEKGEKLTVLMDLNTEWERVHGAPMAQTALLVKGSFARNNAGLLKKVLQSYENSTLWVNHNPENAAAMIVKYQILPDKEIAAKSIPRSHLLYKSASEVKTVVEEYLKLFYETDLEIIGGRLPNENFYL